MVIPVYEDPADQADSPLDLPNASPLSWTWLSTINRVNTQVQKVSYPLRMLHGIFRLAERVGVQTLILTYVTIPARSRVSTELLHSPACLAHYRVRDVVLRRFIPARMRD